MSARYGDNVIDAERAHALVRRPDAARASRDRRRRGRDRGRRRSACRCSGSTGPTRLPRLRRHRRRRHASGRATRSSSPRTGQTAARRAHRHHGRRPRRGRGRRRGDADARPTRSTSAAATCWSPPDAPPEVSDQIAAHLIWMARGAAAARPLLSAQGRHRAPSAPRSASSSTRSTSRRFKPLAAKTLGAERHRPLQSVARPSRSPSTPTTTTATTGSFILIDRFTNATVAAGMIRFGLRRATNIHWQALDVNKAARADAQGPAAGASCGSPACPAPASRPSPTSSRRSSICSAATPICSTATTSATASTATSASPTPTASRTSAASPRRRSCSSTPG